MYLYITHPDIAYAVYIVSLFMSIPSITHYDVVFCILGTLFPDLHCSDSFSFNLTTYYDVDWTSNSTNKFSIIGNYFFLSDSLVSWFSKKQTIVSYFNNEDKYHVLADVTSELIWLHWLLHDIGITYSYVTLIYDENRNTIQIVYNDAFYKLSKHMKTDYHFICHHVL